jgi:hypothetical protein
MHRNHLPTFVPCLYIRGTPDSNDYMLVCVHIDDEYIVSKSEGAIDTFIIDLMKEIHNATLYKPCQKYVGMEIVPETETIVIVHQKTYIKSLKLILMTVIQNISRFETVILCIMRSFDAFPFCSQWFSAHISDHIFGWCIF